MPTKRTKSLFLSIATAALLCGCAAAPKDLPKTAAAASEIPPTIQGALCSTGSPLDVAIQGNGFFKIKIDPTVGDGFGYTRVGAFSLNAQGQLGVGINEGYLLQPPITIPPGATDLAISMDGMVQYRPQGSNLAAVAGRIYLSTFVNPQGLNSQGDGIFTPTPASGKAITNYPGTETAGVLDQTYVEQSTVNRVAMNDSDSKKSE